MSFRSGGLFLVLAVLLFIDNTKAEDGESIVQSERGKLFRDLFSLILPESRPDEMKETGRLVSGGIFNTSVAFTVPVFSFLLPDRVGEGKDYQTQWALAIIGAVLVGGATLIPYIWNAPSIGKKKRSAEEAETEQNVSIVTRISSSAMKMREIMESSSEECFARFVCESSQEPERYGVFGTVIKYMFPVQSVLEKSSSKRRTGDPVTCSDFANDCSYLHGILSQLNYP